jgi:CopG family nickel-responsive transcriptional regulator
MIARPLEESAMPRITITIDDELAEELDHFMAGRGYANRSEAIRDLARSGLQQAATEVAGSRPCVAALVYIYNHEARELPKRLPRTVTGIHTHAHALLERYAHNQPQRRRRVG